MRLRSAATTMVLLLSATCLMAQDAFKIPKGSNLAIVVYEDLECPHCAWADTTLLDASRGYKIPLVRHDFPLPERLHPWAHKAHVYAVYFDSQSKELGEEFRQWVFVHQREIFLANLRREVEMFAAEKGLHLPENVDPQGVFAAKVDADVALGQSINLNHTPTVFVVSLLHGSLVHQEVDVSQLYSALESAKKALDASHPAKNRRTAAHPRG
jgi:protein-disulfide isomerase